LGTLNLGNEKEIEIQLLAKMIAEVLGRPDAPILYTDPRPGDVVRLLSDSSKAKKLLNFKTTAKLRDGLASLATGTPPRNSLLKNYWSRKWSAIGKFRLSAGKRAKESVSLARPHLGERNCSPSRITAMKIDDLASGRSRPQTRLGNLLSRDL
jgi:hypothetical protein